MLEAPIGQGEIIEAIKALKMNTASGPHGLIPEFYKRFRDSLLLHLTDLFMVCAEESFRYSIFIQTRRGSLWPGC